MSGYEKNLKRMVKCRNSEGFCIILLHEVAMSVGPGIESMIGLDRIAHFTLYASAILF